MSTISDLTRLRDAITDENWCIGVDTLGQGRKCLVNRAALLGLYWKTRTKSTLERQLAIEPELPRCLVLFNDSCTSASEVRAFIQRAIDRLEAEGGAR